MRGLDLDPDQCVSRTNESLISVSVAQEVRVVIYCRQLRVLSPPGLIGPPRLIYSPEILWLVSLCALSSVIYVFAGKIETYILSKPSTTTAGICI